MSKSADHLAYERLKERQLRALVAFHYVWEKEQENIRVLQTQIEEAYARIRRWENEAEEMRLHVEDHYKNCLTRDDKKKIKEET